MGFSGKSIPLHPRVVTLIIIFSMINEKVKAALKVILPVIFIAYACSITFFTHTHIVNGVTIVHSHPYASDDNGNPAHEHSGAEIQLIQILSTFFVAGLIVLFFLFGLFSTTRIVPPVRVYLFKFCDHAQGISRLRPPPSLIA